MSVSLSLPDRLYLLGLQFSFLVFLAGCLLSLFLLTHPDNKGHWESSFILFPVQSDDDDDSGDISINVNSWLFIIG